MRIFDTLATRNALPFERLIPALREMFAAGCSVPSRHVHEIDAPSGNGMTSLVMPAWLEGRYYGIKVINIAPGNAELGLPGLHATYLLFDAVTGVPLALMDGNEITARRTAAASALAASFLVPTDAQPIDRHLLVVGAGRIARLLPAAYRAVMPIARISVWARSPAESAALAADLRAEGFEAFAAPDLEAAVRAADIVSCATLSTAPLIHGAWLKPASHLDLIGSFTPDLREADDACFAGAHLYVDTLEALQKSGDLLGPMQRGVFSAGDVRGTLASLCLSATAQLSAANQRTVFKSVGTALEDLAAAMLVWEASEAKP